MSRRAIPIVAGPGGRIFKTMGDGLFLEFPAAVAAARCEMAIQTMMAERNIESPAAKRIVYRIGVNFGDVLIEDDNILGDGVKIAARIETRVSPAAFQFPEGAPRYFVGDLDITYLLPEVKAPALVIRAGRPNGSNRSRAPARR